MSDWATLRDQLNLTLKSIDTWPGTPTPAWNRERGPFSAGLKDTLSTLRKELNALRATAIVLQIAIRPEKLRLDGLPRAGATAEHPGVILAFDSKRGPLRIWFDRFTRWESNLRAIAMHLEHLRMAGLYGVGEDGQQYRGWTALPPGPPVPPQRGTQEYSTALYAAVRRLQEAAGRESTPENRALAANDADEARRLIRAAQAATHPDAGGSDDSFTAIQPAIDTLKERHGL
jgi:hypothetical protein